MHWAFPEKYCNPPVVDINGKFQGVRAKVVGIPGRYTKNRGKNMNFQRSQCKKISGGLQ